MTHAPNPASYGIRRWGQAQKTVSLLLLLIGAGFFIGARLTELPVMPAEVYGLWAARWPAEYWATAVMGCAVAHICGILLNGRSRFSPFVRLAGIVGQSGINATIAIGCAATVAGIPWTIACTALSLILLGFAGITVADCVRAVRGWSNGR